MALLKIMTGFALGAEVLIFAMLPYFYTKAFSNKKLINAFNNFSAGLFLGIAFLHIIPQSNHQISEWISQRKTHHGSQHHYANLSSEEQHHHQLPYGSLISLITFLIVLGLEVYINDGVATELPASQKRTNSHMHQVLSSQKMKMRRRLTLQTYLTQLALSIHSLFQCMSIGVENKQKVMMTLAGAILFHKWAQALTLGFSYSISGMKKEEALKFALFHAILNFSAVIIGYQLSETSNLLKGITNGISGGTFIYITMIEKFGKNFNDNEDLLPKLGLVFTGLIFSILILH